MVITNALNYTVTQVMSDCLYNFDDLITQRNNGLCLHVWGGGGGGGVGVWIEHTYSTQCSDVVALVCHK